MELQELSAFVKVVQTGSFTRAAESLGTQKAHLSRVITQLEKKLGVRLLERTTRSLSLTEVGREMFERAVGIIGAVEDAERTAHKTQAEPRGVLKLTCGVEFGMVAVSRWIACYLQRYPLVQVQAEFTGRLVDLVHEGFDLAIRVGNLPDSSLAARKLDSLEYGLFASPDYLSRRGLPASPDELATHDRLAFSGGAQSQTWRLHKGSHEARVETAPRLVVNNSFAVRDAVIAGLGVAQLPLVVIQPQLSQGLLVRVLPDWKPPDVPVHAVFPSARYLTPKVRAFIDLSVEGF
ncbi:MAG: LysR family transcriptional regulator [Burkholderiales bacterium]|nr:LysR family transcriptional regulator [Burkholderiales bacterium]